MNYLFICRAGVDRSPAAAFVARQIAERKVISLETHSLGLKAILQNPDFKPEFGKYGRVFVMEHWMTNKK